MCRLASLLVLASLLTAPVTAAQQPQPFTIPSATFQEWQAYALTWRSYNGGTRSATATLYGNASRHDSDERPYTVVLVQGEGNRASITEDAKYLAEIIGRDLGVSPTRLAFLFRFAVEGTDRSPSGPRSGSRRRATSSRPRGVCSRPRRSRTTPTASSGSYCGV